MKKSMIKTTLGTWALLVVLFAAGCTPPPQNTNSNQNQNASTGAVALLDSACSEANINDRRTKVFDAVKKKIESSSLKDEYAAGTFKFDVVTAPGINPQTLYLYLEGKISGADKFGDLGKIVKNFMNAKCTSRVVLVPPGTLPLTASSSANIVGFDWLACDYPNVGCPTGECLPPGSTCMMAVPNQPANANTGSNSNANTNSNANSKAKANANGK